MTREKVLYLLFVLLANMHIQEGIDHLSAAELPVIYPGEGIGEIKLGHSMKSVVELWKEKADEIKKPTLNLKR